jgi:K+ transporter
MSIQVMIVGQMEFILLGLLVIVMHAIDQKKEILAGLLFPFLWTKPHLLIVFTLFAFANGGKRIAVISMVFSLVMLAWRAELQRCRE